MVVEAIEKMRTDLGDDVLKAADIADAIVYTLSRPPHVAINEVLVRPTRQSR
jgi:NADP-dependent 3-hydroxy acid dehydrogenase YdfG